VAPTLRPEDFHTTQPSPGSCSNSARRPHRCPGVAHVAARDQEADDAHRAGGHDAPPEPFDRLIGGLEPVLGGHHDGARAGERRG